MHQYVLIEYHRKASAAVWVHPLKVVLCLNLQGIPSNNDMSN